MQPMFANILIFLLAVGLVLAYLAVIHRWLGKRSSTEPEPPPAAHPAPGQGH